MPHPQRPAQGRPGRPSDFAGNAPNGGANVTPRLRNTGTCEMANGSSCTTRTIEERVGPTNYTYSDINDVPLWEYLIAEPLDSTHFTCGVDIWRRDHLLTSHRHEPSLWLDAPVLLLGVGAGQSSSADRNVHPGLSPQDLVQGRRISCDLRTGRRRRLDLHRRRSELRCTRPTPTDRLSDPQWRHTNKRLELLPRRLDLPGRANPDEITLDRWHGVVLVVHRMPEWMFTCSEIGCACNTSESPRTLLIGLGT